MPEQLSRWQWLAFAAIMVVAAAARFALLDRIPPGLWYDEALYSLDGYRVSQGHFALFFAEHGHPREPLFPWLLGAAFALFEPTVLVARCVSAACGTLAVAMMLPIARRFLPANWALAATAAFAVFRWHIHFSRTIFRAGLASPMALLAIWMFLRWRERRRPIDAILCGAASGACLYTYISLRVVPVLLAVWIGWMLWNRTATLRKDGRQIAIIFATAAIVFLPLAVDYTRHPDHLFGRTDEISMFEKDVPVRQPDGTVKQVRVRKTTPEALHGIAENAWGVAKVWFIRGDYVARHGVPYRPIFDPVTGLLFTAGLVLCAWRFARALWLGRFAKAHESHRSDPSVPSAQSDPLKLFHSSREPQRSPGDSPLLPLILLTWFSAFAMASVLSFGAPNILRMQGASPAVILLMILGLQKATALLPPGPLLRRVVPILILAVFAAMQLNDYFRVFPRDLRVRSAFGADFFYAPARAADELAQTADTVYIPEEFLESLQVKFLTIRHKNIRGYAPDAALPQPSASAGKTGWLITARSIALASEADQDQAMQLQAIPGAARRQAFTIPLADADGRLVSRQPWAELWVQQRNP